MFASYLIRLRFDFKKVDPEFVSWFINSQLGRQQVDAMSRQIMMNNINAEELRSLQIPLPPLLVQKQIIQRVAMGRVEMPRERELVKRTKQTSMRKLGIHSRIGQLSERSNGQKFTIRHI